MTARILAAALVLTSAANAAPPPPTDVRLAKTAKAIAERVDHAKTRKALLADIQALATRKRPTSKTRSPAPIPVRPGPVVPGLAASAEAKLILSAVAAARAGKPGAKARLLALAGTLQADGEDRWYRGVTVPPVRPGDKGDLEWEAGQEAGCEAEDGEPTGDCAIWSVSDLPLLQIVAGLVALEAWTSAFRIGSAIRAAPTAAVVGDMLEHATWSAAAAGRWEGALTIARAAGVTRELRVIQAMESRRPRSRVIAAATALMGRLLSDDGELVESPPEAIELARLLVRQGAGKQARKLLGPIETMVGQYDSGGDMAEEEKARDFGALSVAWAEAGSFAQAASAVMASNSWVWQLQSVGPFVDEEDPDDDQPKPSSPLVFVHPQEPLRQAYRAEKSRPTRALRIALASADFLEWELGRCGVVDPAQSKDGFELTRWCPTRRQALIQRRKHAKRLVALSKRLAAIDRDSATRARLRAVELVLPLARPSKVARFLIELARVSGRTSLPMASATAAHILRLSRGEKAPRLAALTVACPKDHRAKRTPDRYGRARAFCLAADGVKAGPLKIREKNGVTVVERDQEERTVIRRSNGTRLSL